MVENLKVVKNVSVHSDHGVIETALRVRTPKKNFKRRRKFNRDKFIDTECREEFNSKLNDILKDCAELICKES